MNYGNKNLEYLSANVIKESRYTNNYLLKIIVESKGLIIVESK
ncbi:11671_t:CDS:1, partial [Racocetra fulgida]